MLKSAANSICKGEFEYKKIEAQIRYLWMTYLSLAQRNKIQIAGIFTKHIKTNDKAEKKEEKTQKKEEEEDNDNGQQRSMKEEEEKVEQMQYEVVKRKRGRKKKEFLEGYSTHEQKKVSFKLQAKHKYLQLQREQVQCENEPQTFLHFVYSTNETTITPQTISYISTKYCLLLLKDLRRFNIGIETSQIKGPHQKVTLKQLETLIKMRGHQFTQRNQMLTVLILEDLLGKWYSEFEIGEQTSLDNLLMIYNSNKQSLGKPIITQIMNYLIKLIDNEPEKATKKYSKIEFPQLSFSLAYALLYVGCLMSSQTLTINDIIQKCQNLKISFNSKIICNEQRITNCKIRKIASVLMRTLNLKYEATEQSMRKWVQKYVNICHLHISYLAQILQFTSTIFVYYKTHIENKNKFVISKRYQFLQQDIISKSIITAFFKLQFGFQNTPYLSAFPYELISKIKTIVTQAEGEQKQKFEEVLRALEIADKMRQRRSSLADSLVSLEAYYSHRGKREMKIKSNFPEIGYVSLDSINTQSLIEIVKRQNDKGFAFSVNLPNVKTSRMTTSISISLSSSLQSVPKIRKCFLSQISLFLKEYNNKQINSQSQLDHPSYNYEFLYDYDRNIKHVGRDVFVRFCQTFVGGECRMSEFYGWLQEMEKVLVDFQS